MEESTITVKSAKKQGYFNITKTAYFGFIITIPLFLIYEIGTLITGAEIRNAAEVWILAFLMNLFHNWTLLAVAVIYILTFLFILLQRNRSSEKHPIQRAYWVISLAEALVYSWILAPVINLVGGFLMSVGGNDGGAIVTSFGAGFFEELFFRVILFGGLFALLTRIKRFGNHRILLFFVVAIGTSLLFSAVHYMGSLGDPFTLSSFLFRFFAGMLFCALFFLRGFGVAAWSHALYDVWVISGIYQGVMNFF
jgi:membrane protease YdiL (CAAX protease family)